MLPRQNALIPVNTRDVFRSARSAWWSSPGLFRPWPYTLWTFLLGACRSLGTLCLLLQLFAPSLYSAAVHAAIEYGEEYIMSLVGPQGPCTQHWREVIAVSAVTIASVFL